MKDLYVYDSEYVIEVLEKEEDKLFEKLNSRIPEELRFDFAAYLSIKASLTKLREEVNRLSKVC